MFGPSFIFNAVCDDVARGFAAIVSDGLTG
jgi:hypothetical protein